MEDSIKGRVIALAKGDPYLTVKDLAREAGTTTRYVRTILSEANLSLHEMRRLYARRLEGDRTRSSQELLSVPRELTIRKVAGREVANALARWQEVDLFVASRLQRQGSLLGFEQLITPAELQIGLKSDGTSLRSLLPSKLRGKLEVVEQKAEILPAPEELASSLALTPGEQVLRLTTYLQVEKEPVALEVRWLALSGLVLKWSRFAEEIAIELGS